MIIHVSAIENVEISSFNGFWSSKLLEKSQLSAGDFSLWYAYVQRCRQIYIHHIPQMNIIIITIKYFQLDFPKCCPD